MTVLAFLFRSAKLWGFPLTGRTIHYIHPVKLSYLQYCLNLSDVVNAYLSTILFSVSGGLEVLDAPEPENILVGPRVGIEYASPEHVMAPWRFAVAGTPWISAPKNTLRPR